MAIHNLYTSGLYLTADEVKSFLDEYKTGTFLEDKTITASSVTGGTKLTISSSHGTFELSNVQRANVEAIRFSSSGVSKVYSTTSNNDAYSHIMGAMLCKNGVIFRSGYYDTNQWKYPMRWCALTNDTNDELAFISCKLSGSTSNCMDGSDVGLLNITYQSSGISSMVITPRWGASMTSMSCIVPDTSSNDIYLPNCFVSPYSQIDVSNTERLPVQAVTIDGVNYITNGKIYIKDA